MDSKYYQFDFLIEGYLLPIDIGKFRISEKLIFERAFSFERDPTGTTKWYYTAYVGFEGDPRPRDFLDVNSYLEFFILLFSLETRLPVTYFKGVAFDIPNLDALGSRRVSFHGLEKIEVLSEPK